MNTQKSFFEQNGGSYTQVGDVLLPDLFIGTAEERPIGKYGRMRKRYLKELHPLLFSNCCCPGSCILTFWKSTRPVKSGWSCSSCKWPGARA